MIQMTRKRHIKLWPLAAALVAIVFILQIFSMIQSASAAATSATIGMSTHALNGTNTGRGANQLILYTYSASQTRTTTNQYGIEVAVNSSNVITAVNHRLQTVAARPWES